jgi:hypothetical protein
MKQLLVGTGRTEITPAPGTPQGGWGAQTHQRGVGADMPMYATALALSNGEDTGVILDVDAIGFDSEWTDRYLNAIGKLTGLDRGHIRLSCTHVHSGPNTFRLAIISEGRDMAERYLEELSDHLAGAAWEAIRNLRPVRVGGGSGSCEVGVNRRFRLPDGRMAVGRNWAGKVDHTVRVVRVDDLNGRPVAVLVNYACHPTIVGWQNQYFTPDYPGPLRKVVEREVGGKCLFLQGAAGNVTPRLGFTGDLNVHHRLGTILGLEAAKIAASIELPPRRETFKGIMESGTAIALYDDEPEETEEAVFRMITRKVALPLKQFDSPDKVRKETERLVSELNALRTTGGHQDEIRAANARAVQSGWKAENARLYHEKHVVERELQCIRVGPIALISTEGEPFIEIALRVIAASPFQHTLFSGYSNGGFGYLPTREAYDEGGYEVETAPFSKEAADVFVDQAQQLLEEIAK